MDSITQRNLDGVYFFMERDGKRKPVCFSDMTEEEMDFILKDQNETWLRNMCKILGQTIRQIGDQLDLVME